MVKKRRPKYFWAKVGLYAFWSVLGVLAIIIITAYGASLMVAGAQTGAGQVTDNTFAGVVCGFYGYAGVLVGGLAVLMVMTAGIVYATSQGQGSGETGIGLAKSMITAAITGVLLYMLGNWLLGSPCGLDPQGGILANLYQKVVPS